MHAVETIHRVKYYVVGSRCITVCNTSPLFLSIASKLNSSIENAIVQVTYVFCLNKDCTYISNGGFLYIQSLLPLANDTY